ncbi:MULTISPECIES: DUF2231 domain-containing protein [unclassified Leifsonia]|uniref:DUF2231 domain-containing protein n=1 Tax=unclassified Leifsonia TaxID=2663824 RepID=UPI0006FAB3D8|nr:MULTISPECIES: DUF2231 domain-containing protein [unclassified Leifsonia]KQX07135.1 hypothetical protein ASC59_04865 [Leifsonia sp. Root1293]KRA11418.1 hypothetical protein ASD61_04865 [Leifsonia sp. Root60]
MDYSFSGLPLHILLVHAVVIVVPVAAIVVLLAAVWPRARRWLGLATPILGVLAAALVYVAKEAGEWLKDRLPDSPLIQEHAELGDTLLPWAIALAVLSIAVYFWYLVIGRRADDSAPSPAVRRIVAIILAVAAVVVVPAGIITTVIIGESGSRAVWEGSFSDTPLEK